MAVELNLDEYELLIKKELNHLESVALMESKEAALGKLKYFVDAAYEEAVALAKFTKDKSIEAQRRIVEKEKEKLKHLTGKLR